MIERYSDKRIAQIWSEENKFYLWQKVELAFIDAQISDGDVATEECIEIEAALLNVPINIEEINRLEKELKHDMNAFLAERRRHIPVHLQRHFHNGNTSYDTEEPAMALMLQGSYDVVVEELDKLRQAILELARQHRYTVMIARTHGQEAELQTFGKRWLGYYRDLEIDHQLLRNARKFLDRSKFSGATGSYTTISPDLERVTLKQLGLSPYRGATQIMPRESYTPLAMALAQTCQTIHKIALTIRLSGRSGRPFCHEPFGKGQMGSSAMPHKKNTIFTEQLEGMARMALGYAVALMQNIPTWEERAIEQSCVERVAWPDLFHVTVHALKRLTSVVTGLVVYPENMLLEITESGGLYASNEVKGLLKSLGEPFGLKDDEAYRIVQLAAFNVFDVKREQLAFVPASKLSDVDQAIDNFCGSISETVPEFKTIIEQGNLQISPQLEANQATVDRWNGILRRVFDETNNSVRWRQAFQPSHLLEHEQIIYKIVGL